MSNVTALPSSAPLSNTTAPNTIPGSAIDPQALIANTAKQVASITASINTNEACQEADQAANSAINAYQQAVGNLSGAANTQANAQAAMNAGVAAYNQCMANSAKDPNLVNIASQIYGSLISFQSDCNNELYGNNGANDKTNVLPPQPTGLDQLPMTLTDANNNPLNFTLNPNFAKNAPHDMDCQNIADGIKSISSSVSSNSQLQMVQLQQYMSNMQQAITLLSQILSKLDDTSSTVINNIGK